MSAEVPSTPTSLPPRKALPPRVWGPVVLLILAGLTASAVYGYRQHKAVRQLTAERSEMMTSLDSTRSLVTALSNRVTNSPTNRLPLPLPHTRTRPLDTPPLTGVRPRIRDGKKFALSSQNSNSKSKRTARI